MLIVDVVPLNLLMPLIVTFTHMLASLQFSCYVVTRTRLHRASTNTHALCTTF